MVVENNQARLQLIPCAAAALQVLAQQVSPWTHAQKHCFHPHYREKISPAAGLLSLFLRPFEAFCRVRPTYSTAERRNGRWTKMLVPALTTAKSPWETDSSVERPIAALRVQHCGDRLLGFEQRAPPCEKFAPRSWPCSTHLPHRMSSL